MPDPARDYELIVIGGGPAGLFGATNAAVLGKKVALIDRHHELGGAGTNTGTVPSKTLRETALAFSGLRSRNLYGVDLSLRREATVSDFLHHEQPRQGRPRRPGHATARSVPRGRVLRHGSFCRFPYRGTSIPEEVGVRAMANCCCCGAGTFSSPPAQRRSTRRFLRLATVSMTPIPSWSCRVCHAVWPWLRGGDRQRIRLHVCGPGHPRPIAGRQGRVAPVSRRRNFAGGNHTHGGDGDPVSLEGVGQELRGSA